jgi:ferrochelatase
VCLLENWREIDSRCLHVAKIWREIKNEVAQQKAMHLHHDHVSKRTTATATTPLYHYSTQIIIPSRLIEDSGFRMIIKWSRFVSILLLINSAIEDYASGFQFQQSHCVGRTTSSGGIAQSRTKLGTATALNLGDSISNSPWQPNNNDIARGEAIMADPKVGVLLLNLGGPETGKDVEGFLYNLFADPDIIRLPPFVAPLQSLVALIISKRRAPKSREAYDSIGGGSPILQYTRAQADLMAKSLKERYGIDAKTYIGMRYWYPFTEEALDKIRADEINALVILPMYPQFSISTSGSSLRVLQEEFAKKSDLYGPQKMFHTVVPSWYTRPGYVKSVASLIQRELDSFSPEEIEEGTSDKQPIPKHVLFSAHGVPASYIEAGDPYKAQIEDCVERIKALLPSEEEGVKVHLSFQSRVGPVEWLRPYTDDVLPSLGEQGVKNLVVVPISFVSEHIETLEEIDIEYRELALESGITNWRRSPALNTDATFIDDMADLVAEALNEPSQSITEACVANNVGNLALESVSNQMEISSAGVGGVGYDDDLTARARLRRGKN